jgi:hypothetical protein
MQEYFRSFVAKLQFAATWILFDISLAVSQLARCCALAVAGIAQWTAFHHLMEYVSHQPSFKITYRRGIKLVDLLSGFADADWGNSSSRRSTSGMVMLYTKSPMIMMWKSKKQKTTAPCRVSTAEANYYSASMAGCEVLYLLALLHHLGFEQKKPTQVYEDNTACIEWGNNLIGRREKNQAHQHPEALCPRSHPKWSDAAGQGLDYSPNSRHPDQGTTSSASTSMRKCSLASAVQHEHLKDLCSQEGAGCHGYRVESRSPLRCFTDSLEAKARARHQLESGLSESR